MKDQTTVKSMNLSSQKTDSIMNIKVSQSFKCEVVKAAKMCNMSCSAFIRIAVEEKMQKIKE